MNLLVCNYEMPDVEVNISKASDDFFYFLTAFECLKKRVNSKEKESLFFL